MNKAPLLLLVVLTCILVFVIGLRYGQYVERTNKQNAAAAQLTPSPTTQPAKQNKGFRTFSHVQCGFQVLLPNSFEKGKQSSTSASFLDEGASVASFSCDKVGTGSAKTSPYTGKKIFYTADAAVLPLIEKTLTFLK